VPSLGIVQKTRLLNLRLFPQRRFQMLPLFELISLIELEAGAELAAADLSK
jgi:hypothetical protein